MKLHHPPRSRLSSMLGGGSEAISTRHPSSDRRLHADTVRWLPLLLVWSDSKHAAWREGVRRAGIFTFIHGARKRCSSSMHDSEHRWSLVTHASRHRGTSAGKFFNSTGIGERSVTPNGVLIWQAHASAFTESCRSIYAIAGRRGFMAGLLPRTISLVGSLFTVPFTIERIQPLVERHL